MTRLTKRMIWIALLLAWAGNAGAFALLGPFKADGSFTGGDWQTAGYGGPPEGLGYTTAGTSSGGPMFPFEAYRWNVPVVTYAFDSTFLRYFGPKGVAAVEEAIAVLNSLPPASQMSPTLTEFSLDTRGHNATAANLGLLDVKTYALHILLEEMGLANPERFVWNLRSREVGTNPDFTNYTVIQLNYDPVTIQPSRYVNGVLYNYEIHEDLGPVGNEWASALEWYQLDPLLQPYSSVAGAIAYDFQLEDRPGVFRAAPGLTVGDYFTGLTRDDVGGLRFLLSTNHIVVDTLPPTVLPRTGGTRGGSPWAPILSTNIFGTNATGVSNIISAVGTNLTNFVRTALRPGVDKITFQRMNLLGTNFTPMTIRYTDRYINPTNGRVVRQPVERLLLQADIIFGVADQGTIDEIPVIFTRTYTTGWANNAAQNTVLPGAVGLGGPGTITPPIFIQFSDMIPYLFNREPLQGEPLFGRSGIWGSFDGTDREPVVFPIFQHPVAPDLSLEYLRDLALGRTSR